MLIKKLWNPDVSALVTPTVNTQIEEVENKTPDVRGLIKKTDYNVKISNIEAKYFTTSEYDTFTTQIVETKAKEKRLAGNSGNIFFCKKSDINTN